MIALSDAGSGTTVVLRVTRNSSRPLTFVAVPLALLAEVNPNDIAAAGLGVPASVKPVDGSTWKNDAMGCFKDHQCAYQCKKKWQKSNGNARIKGKV